MYYSFTLIFAQGYFVEFCSQTNEIIQSCLEGAVSQMFELQKQETFNVILKDFLVYFIKFLNHLFAVLLRYIYTKIDVS